MAGIVMSGQEEKVPAEEGYSFNYAVVPNKVLAGGSNTGSGSGTGAGTSAGETGAGNYAGAGVSSGSTGGNKTGSFGGGSSGSHGSKDFLDTTFGKYLQGLVSQNGYGNIFGTSADGNYSPIIGGLIGSTDIGKDMVSKGQYETNINDLKNKYAAMLRQQHDYSAEKLKAERDEALRENWVLQQQAEAALPEQLAAAGMNGGASETTLAALKARYQGDRNNIRSGYMDDLGELSQQNARERAEAERSYNEKLLDYLLSLEKMEKEFAHEKALAAMNK